MERKLYVLQFVIPVIPRIHSSQLSSNHLLLLGTVALKWLSIDGLLSTACIPSDVCTERTKISGHAIINK